MGTRLLVIFKLHNHSFVSMSFHVTSAGIAVHCKYPVGVYDCHVTAMHTQTIHTRSAITVTLTYSSTLSDIETNIRHMSVAKKLCSGTTV